MQGPEHVVTLYVATCGQNGSRLGSDEKEIILLVYVILEAATGQIVGTKQILVRPDGSFVKDRTVSSSSDTSNAAASPPLAITYSDINCNNNSTNNNNNNNDKNASNIVNNNNNFINNATNYNNNNNSSIINTITNNAIGTTTNNNNNNNNDSNNSNTNNGNIITNGSTVALLQTENNCELPIAAAQAVGKPLNEAIEEFDEYLRSLMLSEVNIKLITDGQLPLRQCVHREASAKDIELPGYYNRFCDLRKEFLIYKAGDLSRALVPIKDIKKMLQKPQATPPQSISEMINELNIPSSEDGEFYVRESRDMVAVVKTLLNAGHKFVANEIVNLVLEPGICSIDDEIDGNCIVRARGLPWQSSDQDIAKFFRGLNVAKGGVALCLSPLGRRNGEALIRFVSQEHRDMALKRHKHHIGNRYIEVYPATGEDFLAVAGGASNEAQAFLSKGAQVIIRMRGLPYDCTAKQVLDFFTTGDSPCNVLDGTEGVLFVKKPDGRATGDAFVLFANESDAPKALSRHRESIGQRYIELFRSTTAEVQQVLNRSMDPKTYESNHQPPLIAQLPTMQLSLLPQHLITSGTTKNCIRLRGLPYEALVEHILHFLDDFAKHIIYQGVHMVINAQGQPSGEAFIQMDSEESARLCAQRKHNQFMVFGKKYRYIEVFQCSGDDMNAVLNGGLQSPVAAHPHSHHPGAKQPSLLSPGASVIGAPFGAFAHFGPPPATAILAASPHRPHHPHATHPHAHHTHATAAATFYPHPLIYWPYPSPPVSPTTYFSQPTPSPTHLSASSIASAQHQAMYSLDFLSAVPPGNYATAAAAAAAAQASPMSPPSIAIPQHTVPPPAGLIISSPNHQKAPTTMTLVPQKQYSPLTVPVPAAALTSTAAAMSPTLQSGIQAFHSKLSTSQPQPQQQKTQMPPHQHVQAQLHQPTNNIYRYSTPPPGAAVTPTGTTLVASTPISMVAAPLVAAGTVTPTIPPPPQALLSIDTSHGHGHPNPHVAHLQRSSAKHSANNKLITNSTPMTTGTGAPSGQGGGSILPSNQCVELFIS